MHVDDEKSMVETGDLVIIKPKQKVFFITDNLKMITITKPNFYYEQYEEIIK